MMDWLLTAIIALGVIHAATGTILIARERRRAARIGRTSGELPPVTILKPLKGLDGSLVDNLRSFFQLDYPGYELIFGIRDLDDPAVTVVRRLQREYPDIVSRLIISDDDLGFNPKVNNLSNAMKHARFDVLVVSDSNVRVRPDYLRSLVHELMQPNVELVTSIIRGVGGSGLGSILESLHLNGFVAGATYTVSRLLRIPVTIGKSMCFRRQLLEQLGGWESLANYLIEDALLGREVTRQGSEIGQCFQAVDNVNNGWTFTDFVSRHVRWSIMRRHLSLSHYLAEIAGNPIALATLNAGLNPGIEAAALWLGVAAAKVGLDLASARMIGDRAAWYRYLLIPPKDVLMGLIWLVPFFRRTVKWRGNRFHLRAHTLITPAGESPLADARRRMLSGLSWKTSPREA